MCTFEKKKKLDLWLNCHNMPRSYLFTKTFLLIFFFFQTGRTCSPSLSSFKMIQRRSDNICPFASFCKNRGLGNWHPKCWPSGYCYCRKWWTVLCLWLRSLVPLPVPAAQLVSFQDSEISGPSQFLPVTIFHIIIFQSIDYILLLNMKHFSFSALTEL